MVLVRWLEAGGFDIFAIINARQPQKTRTSDVRVWWHCGHFCRVNVRKCSRTSKTREDFDAGCFQRQNVAPGWELLWSYTRTTMSSLQHGQYHIGGAGGAASAASAAPGVPGGLGPGPVGGNGMPPSAMVTGGARSRKLSSSSSSSPGGGTTTTGGTPSSTRSVVFGDRDPLLPSDEIRPRGGHHGHHGHHGGHPRAGGGGGHHSDYNAGPISSGGRRKPASRAHQNLLASQHSNSTSQLNAGGATASSASGHAHRRPKLHSSTSSLTSTRTPSTTASSTPTSASSSSASTASGLTGGVPGASGSGKSRWQKLFSAFKKNKHNSSGSGQGTGSASDAYCLKHSHNCSNSFLRAGISNMKGYKKANQDR